MRREAWSLWLLGGVPVAVAQLDGRWSVVARRGAASAASLDAALRRVQSS